MTGTKVKTNTDGGEVVNSTDDADFLEYLISPSAPKIKPNILNGKLVLGTASVKVPETKQTVKKVVKETPEKPKTTSLDEGKEMMFKKNSTPWIDCYNTLHYWEGKELKTFDCSNLAISTQTTKEEIELSSGIKYKREYLPKNICKALLKTGEYFWSFGDSSNAHFSEVLHKCYKVTDSDKHILNSSSNPGYGSIWNEEEKLWKDCPRCRAVYAIYDSYEPLKYKVWDIFIAICNRIESFFFNIYKQFEVFFWLHSKEAKDVLIGYRLAIESGKIYYLTSWRKQFRKKLNSEYSAFVTLNSGYLYYNPKIYPQKKIMGIVRKFVNKNYSSPDVGVIWEYFDGGK